MKHSELIKLLYNDELEIVELPMSTAIKGLYADNIIAINKNINTTAERICVLAEELGHYFTSVGDILNLKIESNRKQEIRAKNWAIQKLVPFDELVYAHQQGYVNVYELAEYFDVTEDFMKEAVLFYQRKYRRFDDYT
jgi:Zn-dependent peptidase ImmA (M78 family)